MAAHDTTWIESDTSRPWNAPELLAQMVKSSSQVGNGRNYPSFDSPVRGVILARLILGPRPRRQSRADSNVRFNPLGPPNLASSDQMRNDPVMTAADPRVLLRSLFDAAVAAADPMLRLGPHLPEPPKGRTIVVGAGKAAASMAAALEAQWMGPLEGLVVTRVGHGAATRRIRVVEAGHPVPDAAGADAAREILGMMNGLTSDDLVVGLISGGGSALLSLPGGALTLTDLQAINRALLKSGARIDEFNTVRKHMSSINGGRLAAAAAPARFVTLIISDTPGDDPSVIASGPSVADPSTLADARDVLARHHIEAPPRVAAHLADPASETPKSGDPRLIRAETRLIARPRDALLAAAEKARAAGYAPLILGDAIEGEARECGIVHAGVALSAARHGDPIRPPCVLLSGGETTVTVRGKGRGGRNGEFLLSLALALDGREGISALAADTDGIDGTEDNAGAILTPDTLRRARALGLNPRAHLDDDDAYSVFSALGDLLITGPTRTNVNDFRAILIERPTG
jgi:glycerate 2-kinase